MRIRSLALLAVVAAFAASFIMPASINALEADGFLRCFRVYVPVTDDGFGFRPSVATVIDYETGDPIFINFNPYETNNEIEYYIALSDTQVGVVGSWEDGVVFAGDDEFGAFTLVSSDSVQIEEVEWAYCDGAIMDGRLNSSDLGALAYVYPAADGFSVWELNLGDMKGYQQFTATRADIAAAIALANETGVNQAIGTTERGTSLWALVGGTCQLNHFELDGKINEFAFVCA